ncbi:MAG: DUF5686 and carboxypeptidase regulatory-like domain-containing protein [Bacteroidota bacterium]
MKNLTFTLFALLAFQLQAQISGTITDEKGEPLPFASIYLQASSTGTTSNAEGQYNLELPAGNYVIVFQYVGYEQKLVELSYDGRSKQLDIQLKEEAVTLNEVTVRADAEDPAYAIIRKAIEKRPYYRKLVKGSSCNAYIKGIQWILDAPEKILGQEIGDLGGSLDSNRQGIIYLSESLARYHRQQPDRVKEQMISSKVSGNDNGFSFNRASLMDFNLYDSHIEIEREILSPIADNALAYYRYRLEGTTFDESGRLVNKISLLPKRKEDPVFSGTIYITEDLWNIYSADLILTGTSIKQPVLDTLIIRQIHVPVRKPDTWMVLSQTIDFKFAVFGFKGHGTFTGVFSDYEIDPAFESGFFNNEIFKVGEEANERSLIYWDSLRPIPLTEGEQKDYVKKDSLQKIWDSREFKDSMDRKNNKFTFGNLLFGYQHSNSYRRRFWSIGSPLTTIQFNTIQGYYGDLRLRFRREFDEYYMRWYSIEPTLQFGLADEAFRGGVNFRYNFNRTRFSRLSISAGKMTEDINSTNPMSRTLNTYWTLLFRRNFLKLYDRTFVDINYRQEIANGLMFYGGLEYSERAPLVNNTNFSYFDHGDREYTSNRPFEGSPVDACELCVTDHKAFITSFSLRFRPGQKYMSYPGRKYILGTKYPSFILQYRKAFAVDKEYLDYDMIRFRIEDDFTLGIFGKTQWNVSAGTFLNNENIQLTDFKNFQGNEIFVSNPERYANSFFRLPYYGYATNESFLEAHLQHHFEGFILDKIPLLRKLNWKSVLSANLLIVEQDRQLFEEPKDLYWEIAYGFDNIGFGAFRLFRVDVATSFEGSQYDGTSVILGIRL